jgi:hypothetical protein
MKRRMTWPWRPPSVGDMVAIISAVILAVALVWGLLKSPSFVARYQRPNGFGPDWDCANTPNSEPVCVKRVPTPAPAHPASTGVPPH